MTTRWANIEDEGALAALLGRVADRFAPASIDALWIFPTRRSIDAESTVIVLSRFDDDRSRRRVGTVHFLVVRDPRGHAAVNEKTEEHASTPPEAVERIIDGVLRRLEHEADAPPRHVEIRGSADAWTAFVDEVTDPASRPRAAATPEPAPEPSIPVESTASGDASSD
ncbi:MAG: hypothetical protein L0271_19360 [Gemmatimonadetes bacterium]|nr:hypothetical protein [Gemmatimonadota bacterium]